MADYRAGLAQRYGRLDRLKTIGLVEKCKPKTRHGVRKSRICSGYVGTFLFLERPGRAAIRGAGRKLRHQENGASPQQETGA